MFFCDHDQRSQSFTTDLCWLQDYLLLSPKSAWNLSCLLFVSIFCNFATFLLHVTWPLKFHCLFSESKVEINKKGLSNDKILILSMSQTISWNCNRGSYYFGKSLTRNYIKSTYRYFKVASFLGVFPKQYLFLSESHSVYVCMCIYICKFSNNFFLPEMEKKFITILIGWLFANVRFGV